jgi:glycosyltransferase involved in cell wall biosynthesis
MRFLVVAEDFPWPQTGGGLIRLATAVTALCELGEVDLFTLVRRHRTLPPTVPPSVKVARLQTVPYPLAPNRFRLQVAWMLAHGTPMRVVRGRLGKAPRVEFEKWVADQYDLVWFSTAAMYDWMNRPHLGPTVVDLVDLEDEKAQQRIEVALSKQSERGFTRIRRTVALAQERRTIRGWRNFQRSVAAGVDRVVVCSELDLKRSGLPNAMVIPNTYDLPEMPVGKKRTEVPPTLLFHGSLEYLPNEDAAGWLVGEIAPRIRSRLPEARIRLVGVPSSAVKQLDNPPAVTVVGSVGTMESELVRADIVITPIRFGSGTRIKIIEAFAHRIPVVSTTIGAEGLFVEDGHHLLLADRPEELALACERLIVDPELRNRLVDAAHDLYLEKYQGSVARQKITELALELGTPHTR